jgi:hypothetical protein
MPSFVRILEANTEYNALVNIRQAQTLEEEAEKKPAYNINSRFSIPTFGQGYASAIDWAGSLAPRVEELRGGGGAPDEADAAALAGDWKAVGKDLKKVVNKYGAEST